MLNLFGLYMCNVLNVDPYIIMLCAREIRQQREFTQLLLVSTVVPASSAVKNDTEESYWINPIKCPGGMASSKEGII